MIDYKRGNLAKKGYIISKPGPDKIRNQIQITDELIRYLKGKSRADPILFQEELKKDQESN